MSAQLLIDTSVIIDFLRGQSDEILEFALLNSQALLSTMVRLELLAGSRKAETKVLSAFMDAFVAIPDLPLSQQCEKLLMRARGSGLMGGIPDIIILADLQRTESVLYTVDRKLKLLAKKLRLPVLD